MAQTEQAVCQKAELKSQGLSDAEIEASRPRKKFVQEQHFDGCRIGFSPLDENTYQCTLAMNTSNEMAIHDFYFFDDIYVYDDISDYDES